MFNPVAFSVQVVSNGGIKHDDIGQVSKPTNGGIKRDDIGQVSKH